MQKETRHKIAEEYIIWLKPVSVIAKEINIKYIDVLNYIKSEECKEFEKKWIFKKIKTHHEDLFETKKPKISYKKLLKF